MMTVFSSGGLRTRTATLAVGALALAGLLAACGGGDEATTASSATASVSATGGPGPGGGPGGGGFAGLDMQAVQSCLQAAGVSMPAMPSGRPSFSGTERPTFSRDPNSTGRPSGTQLPGGGGVGGFPTDPAAQAALEACGITVPTLTPGSQPGQPTASPSS